MKLETVGDILAEIGPNKEPAIKYHSDIFQGTDEWHELRRGILTASEMRLIMTPTGKIANNDKTRAHVYEIAAQRITGHTEPRYVNDDMMRGHLDEEEARKLYTKHYGPAELCGFVTNDTYGFRIGYSPDALVGRFGLLEIKSRSQRFQVQTIASDHMPDEYLLQVQTALLVTGREWLDFISYSNGMPLYRKRIEADPDLHAAIIEAASAFESRVQEVMMEYRATVAAKGLPETPRIERDMEIYQ